MTTEHEIGKVVAVDTAQVTVELNRDLKALTRSTYEGTIEVGRINSYIIIPVRSRRIVGMVTRVVMSEENKFQADKMMVSLPSTRRLMKATMIGSISDADFRQRINLFPCSTPKCSSQREGILTRSLVGVARALTSIGRIPATVSISGNQ